MATTLLFKAGQQVIWNPTLDGNKQLAELQRAYSAGPFRVVEVRSCGQSPCNCGSPPGYPHSSSCPKGLGRLLGHPQWLILTDLQGRPINSCFHDMGPVQLSGRWFAAT
ncbi:hypothetical protein HYX70_03455 [Candidatus Saccharibacteria bacterium]|nr:hypothetical protein [Candidatus Saccharibacteria bacterium]